MESISQRSNLIAVCLSLRDKPSSCLITTLDLSHSPFSRILKADSGCIPDCKTLSNTPAAIFEYWKYWNNPVNRSLHLGNNSDCIRRLGIWLCTQTCLVKETNIRYNSRNCLGWPNKTNSSLEICHSALLIWIYLVWQGQWQKTFFSTLNN
jgi:hypothetical protein